MICLHTIIMCAHSVASFAQGSNYGFCPTRVPSRASSRQCISPATTSSFTTIRCGNVVAHVHRPEDLAFIASTFFSLSGQGALGTNPIAGTAHQLHHILDAHAGVPHADIRLAMLACRGSLSPESVNWINRCNDAYKCIRHNTIVRQQAMLGHICAELRSPIWCCFLQTDGFSTIPQKRVWSRGPPGTWCVPHSCLLAPPGCFGTYGVDADILQCFFCCQRHG